MGHAIPAQSYAVAANAVLALDDSLAGGINRNFNMQSLRVFPNGEELPPLWPQERIKGDEEDYDWLHSDFRNVAMPYVYEMYDVMLDQGGLRGEQQ